MIFLKNNTEQIILLNKNNKYMAKVCLVIIDGFGIREHDDKGVGDATMHAIHIEELKSTYGSLSSMPMVNMWDCQQIPSETLK